MDKSILLKNDTRKLLTIFYFTVLSIYFGFGNTPFQLDSKIKDILCIVLGIIFILWMLLQSFKMKELVATTVMILFALATMYNSVIFIFIDVLTGIIFSRSNKKFILKLIGIERLFFDLYIIICSLLGKIQNKVIVAKSGEYVTGYGLGFDNPNNLACEIGMLMMIYIMIKEKKLKYIEILGIILTSLLTYTITKSRTFIIMMIIMVVMILIIKRFSGNKKFIQIEMFTGISSILLGYVISLGIPYIINLQIGNISNYINILNKLTSERFLHASRVMLNYPVTLFGGTVNFDRLILWYGYDIIDNSYIRLLYSLGLVGTAIFCIIYIITVVKISKLNRPYWILPIIIFSLWGISEGILFNLHWNVSILLWGVALYSGNNEMYEKEVSKL